MRIVHYFTGSDDAAANRRAMLSVFLIIAVIVGAFMIGTATKADAAEQQDHEQTAPALTSQLDSALAEKAQLQQEVDILRQMLAASEEKCEVLSAEAAAAQREAEQLRGELEAIRQENAISYEMRFRVERNVTFPEDSEILYFTRTVDEETYNRWQNGNVITETTGFLTIPNNGMLHEWVVIMESKYLVANQK